MFFNKPNLIIYLFHFFFFLINEAGKLNYIQFRAFSSGFYQPFMEGSSNVFKHASKRAELILVFWKFLGILYKSMIPKLCFEASWRTTQRTQESLNFSRKKGEYSISVSYCFQTLAWYISVEALDPIMYLSMMSLWIWVFVGCHNKMQVPI